VGGGARLDQDVAGRTLTFERLSNQYNTRNQEKHKHSNHLQSYARARSKLQFDALLPELREIGAHN
jgi:hypothetical protein